MKNEVNNMKGGERAMEVEEVTRKRYSELCPICMKKIIAFNEDGLRYNMDVHLDKHKRNGEFVKPSQEKE